VGILITQDFASCTHLASPRIVRTQKFVCALAHGPVVISDRFIDDCLANGGHLDPEDYLLEDKEFEKKVGYKLSGALLRAKENKGRLLRGHSIYVTEAVRGGFETYRSIIEVNGGKCLMYRARAATSLRAGVDEDTDGSESGQPEFVYLVSGQTHEEAKLWPKFKQMVEAAGKNPRIVRNDWLLNTAASLARLLRSDRQGHWYSTTLRLWRVIEHRARRSVGDLASVVDETIVARVRRVRCHDDLLSALQSLDAQ